ncbi:MAG: DoxX family protein [Chitinophagaceae bacterium]|nr:DoxX family protein [Chitinophagaceae bacterium]
MKLHIVLLWVCRITAAAIMLQTLFFKFTASDESVYIFTRMGIEPWGRIGTGVAELVASLLILIPSVSVYGAIIALGIMAGALASHILVLGIEVQGDGGQLFIYAMLVFAAAAYIIFASRRALYTQLKAVWH